MAKKEHNACSVDAIADIKKLYHAYRHTSDIDRKGLFFSPTCLQICRPTPSYATTTRGGIVQFLKDAQEGIVPVHNSPSVDAASTPKAPNTLAKGNELEGKGVYTIRALQPSEYKFGNDEITAPINLTVKNLEQKAEEENWIGMRVNLWTEGGAQDTLFVKVQYWWRREVIPEDERLEDEGEIGWRQCLHDIMYLGPKDGTEVEVGLEVL
ncbi:hypothetical protein BKA66DRAFT_453219, partial [Pyrenochaeta sp. MPI-SDFR-AT-0127]